MILPSFFVVKTMAKYPDFYYPIPGNTRRETLVLSFSNIVRNINQAIVYYMIDHPDLYPLEKYPILEKIKTMHDPKGLKAFSLTTMIPQRYLLNILRGGELEEQEDDESILREIRSNYDAKRSYHTKMEGALFRLFSSARMVDKMYIYDPMADIDHSLDELFLRMFPNSMSATCETTLSTEPPYEILQRDKNVTTVIIEEFDEAIFILENLPIELLSGKSFWISGSCIANTTEMTQSGRNAKQDRFESLANEKKVQINYFISAPLEIKE